MVTTGRTITISGRKLAALRRAFPLTQDELASLADVTPATIKRIEPLAITAVFLGNARRLAEALKVGVKDLSPEDVDLVDEREARAAGPIDQPPGDKLVAVMRLSGRTREHLERAGIPGELVDDLVDGGTAPAKTIRKLGRALGHHAGPWLDGLIDANQTGELSSVDAAAAFIARASLDDLTTLDAAMRKRLAALTKAATGKKPKG